MQGMRKSISNAHASIVYNYNYYTKRTKTVQLLLILLHPVLIEYLEPTKSMPNFFVCLMADFKQILLYEVFYHSDPILLSPLHHNSLAKFKSPSKNRFHKDELATASDPSDPVYAHILFGSFWMTRISISAIVQFESK